MNRVTHRGDELQERCFGPRASLSMTMLAELAAEAVVNRASREDLYCLQHSVYEESGGKPRFT